MPAGVGAALAVADRAYVLQCGEAVFDGDIAALHENPEILTTGYLGGRAPHTPPGPSDAPYENGH